MKLTQIGASAVLLSLVSLGFSGLKASVNAASLDETATTLELAQVGSRPGDVCRRVRGEGLSLYADTTMDSREIVSMFPNEQVNLIRSPFRGVDGELWVEVEDSVGNIGFMRAETWGSVGDSRVSTLVYCPGGSAFPVTW